MNTLQATNAAGETVTGTDSSAYHETPAVSFPWALTGLSEDVDVLLEAAEIEMGDHDYTLRIKSGEGKINRTSFKITRANGILDATFTAGTKVLHVVLTAEP